MVGGYTDEGITQMSTEDLRSAIEQVNSALVEGLPELLELVDLRLATHKEIVADKDRYIEQLERKLRGMAGILDRAVADAIELIDPTTHEYHMRRKL